MPKVIGYAAKGSKSDLRPRFVERQDPRSNEVAIDVLFCGVCHSDVHQVKNEWMNTIYPCMPGHEIVGRVTATGGSVSRHKVGDLVGVGCMIDSCHECSACRAGLENYCEKGFLATYNGNMRHPSVENNTFGGYSNMMVVREDFVLKIPANLDPAKAAPIMCAGVTTYSPLRHWKVGKGTRVGIVGLGGLGQMAVKLAKAMGADVTVLTTHHEKKTDALKYGAKNVILSDDKDQMKSAESSIDVMLSTIPTTHDANPYMPLLARDGTYVVVGCLLPLKLPLLMNGMITDRRSLGSTLIGSIQETQEVLDFCSQNDILPETRTIPIDEINDAYAKIDKGEIDFRYVIDMKSLEGKEEDLSFWEKAGL